MAHAEATATLPIDVNTLWQQIGSFQGVGDWHPLLAHVHGEGEAPGATRTATGQDGSQQVERLREADPDRHLYRYAMESTALPVTGYVAEFRAEAAGTDVTTVRWSADFQVSSDDEEQAIEMVRGFLRAGLDNLTKRYG